MDPAHSLSAHRQTLIDNIRFAADFLAEDGIRYCSSRSTIGCARLLPGPPARRPGLGAGDRQTQRGVQLDLYHAQIMDGDLTRLIGKLGPAIGHVQIASVPDRHEPDEGEIAYPTCSRRWRRRLPRLDRLRIQPQSRHPGRAGLADTTITTLNMNESEDNKMQIIITGGGGFLGQKLARALLQGPTLSPSCCWWTSSSRNPLPDPRVRCLRPTSPNPVSPSPSSASGPPWSTTWPPSSAATRSGTSIWAGRSTWTPPAPCWRRAAMPGPASASSSPARSPSMAARCRSW